MLRVTEKAKEALEKFLQKQEADLEFAMRIIYSPTEQEGLELALDKERKGDLVIESDAGRKLLLIQSNLVTKLEGMTFYHKETNHGISFVLSKPASQNG